MNHTSLALLIHDLAAVRSRRRAEVHLEPAAQLAARLLGDLRVADALEEDAACGRLAARILRDRPTWAVAPPCGPPGLPS